MTSKSVTKQTTYGIYDPKGADEVVQEKAVHVKPSTRTVQTEEKGGGIFGLAKRRKKPGPPKSEDFAEALKR